MDITHIGNSIVKTPQKNFHLNNVLHIPHASKNLVSVHRFTLDNNVLIILYPYSFVIKDLATRRVILRGRCEGGLYPITSSSSSSRSNKQAWSVTKPSSESGTNAWVIHLQSSFSMSLAKINFLLCLVLSQFVMRVNKQKVINYHIPSLLVYLLLHYNLSFQMCGGQPPPHLVDFLIM